MPDIFTIHSCGIKECGGRFFKRDAMFCLVRSRLFGVPLEHRIMYILNEGSLQVARDSQDGTGGTASRRTDRGAGQ